ncbi:copper resistance protein CopB [Sphingorhabdus lutea]|uniref:Copper resistance protein CopB n=2 Tax=Sphingorhabdus lutea TaxID=1913578 RepID=A0A1L3JEG1_9SPHN|nr:copper resistance protein CopB [Sphingorhabdus lutea]
MHKICLFLAAASTASAPLSAQDHSQHGDHSAHQAEETKPAPPAIDHSVMDHSKMDHSQMDHSTLEHSAPKAAASPARPPNSTSGPARAADAIWGAEAMRPSRKALYEEHGDMQIFWFQGDRLEYRAREGGDGYLWDVQGYYGGDLDKFWFKSEGEGSFGESAEQAEIQALYSRAIAPFFDLQVGIRQDFTGPDRTYGVVGVQGLVPYMLEVDAAAFLSDKGDLTGRIEAEYDQRITDRLILQPRAEMNFSAQDIAELDIGSGIDSAELGLRLRYEIEREFAPYIGVEQEWKLGGSKDFARADGEDASVTNYVIGVRFWF